MGYNRTLKLDIRYLCILMLAISSFFIPFYKTAPNQHNLSFAMAEIPMAIFIIVSLLTGMFKGTKNYLFLLLTGVYFAVFLYYDIAFLKCHWALIYKTVTFVFIWLFVKIDTEKSLYNAVIIDKMVNAFIMLFTIAVVLSFVCFVLNIDSIKLQFPNISFRSRGSFSDSRITWVFMHKSGYGMFLAIMTYIVLKKDDLKYRKVHLVIYIIALILVNSIASIVAVLGILYAHYFIPKKITRNYLVLFFLSLIAIVAVGVVAFNLISSVRNVSTLGKRFLFWQEYPHILARYPKGMGKSFFDIEFFISKAGFSISNFHNVFLNEILHYSMPVGILYTILILYFPFLKAAKSKTVFKNIVVFVCLLIPLCIDMALNDTTAPMYMVLMYICFIDFDEIKNRKALYYGSGK